MPNTLARWDPMTELANMRTIADRLLGQGYSRLPLRNGGEELGPMQLTVDVFETNESFVVTAAVPGIDPKDVDIQVNDDVLTIRGEFRPLDEIDEDQYLRREMRYGPFERALRLPPTVDAERAHCTFENGVLKLDLPKKPEARSKSIRISPEGVLEGERSGPPEQ